MGRICALSVVALLALALVGCGGSGSSGSPGLPVGYVVAPGGATYTLIMNPPPPKYAPPPTSGSGFAVSLAQVSSFTSGAGFWNPATQSEQWNSTTQVAYGTVSGVDLSAVELAVFSLTNIYYVQPITGVSAADGCYITINADGSWVAPCDPGTVHGFVAKKGYYVAATYGSLPPVDGVNILAEF